MLRLENISKYYHSGDVVALGLRKVSLELKLGEFVAVTGESGSGKSTLLNVISGLDTYEDGEMYVNGEETSYYTIEEWESYRRQYIGFVFQNYNIIDSYSVLENVMVALTIQGYDKERRKQRALELIERVGLSSHINHKASKLSGGQKQRAVIARALAKDCPIIVADEPTGNLDSETGKNIMALLKEISREKLVVVVTHNYPQVAEYATRRIRLFDGEVIEDEVIKPRKEMQEGVTLANYKIDPISLMGIAFRNLIRTPRRTIFTTIIAMFIALIFVFSYGSFKAGTTGTSYAYGGIFENTINRRIVVAKVDGTPFTAAEISELEGLDHVHALFEHDAVLDSVIIQFSYNEEWDYLESNYSLMNPVSMLQKEDLKEGRLPQSKYEIVVSSSAYSVGEYLKLSFEYPESYDRSPTLSDVDGEVFEVVGVTKNINPTTWQDSFYFTDEYLNQEDILATIYAGTGWGRQYVQMLAVIDAGNGEIYTVADFYDIVFDATIPVGDVELGFGMLTEVCYSFGYDLYEDPNLENDCLGQELTLMSNSNFYTKQTTITIADRYVVSDMNDEWNYKVAMNYDTYISLLDLSPYQMSLLVLTPYEAQLVMDELSQYENILAVYPASITATDDGLEQFINTLVFSFQLIILLGVMYFITYLVLRNIQNAKIKDFLIFRSIGASKKDLHLVTIIELIYVFILGFALVMLFVIYNEFSQVWFFPQYLVYFTVGSYFVLVGLSVFLAILLGRRFNKRIFGRSVITSLKQE